jgi:hypothetical protein
MEPAPLPHGISAGRLDVARLDVARLDVARLDGFFRFFSLPLESGLRSLFLKETRRNGGEAAALARAASASKGVSLTAEALARYAAAIDPRLRLPRGKDGRGSAEAAPSPAEAVPPGGGPFSKNDPLPGGIPEALRRALEYARREAAPDGAPDEPSDGALAILNRLPGKNGARWVVYPFDFSAKNIAFTVSVRLLYRTEDAVTPCRLAVDIAARHYTEHNTDGGEAGRSWLFVLERPGGVAWRSMRVFRSPPPPEKERRRLERALRAEMGGGFAGAPGAAAISLAADYTPFADALDAETAPVDVAV